MVTRGYAVLFGFFFFFFFFFCEKKKKIRQHEEEFDIFIWPLITVIWLVVCKTFGYLPEDRTGQLAKPRPRPWPGTGPVLKNFVFCFCMPSRWTFPHGMVHSARQLSSRPVHRYHSQVFSGRLFPLSFFYCSTPVLYDDPTFLHIF